MKQKYLEEAKELLKTSRNLIERAIVEKYSIPYLSREQLQQLRSEIVLNSCYLHDYNNSLGLDSHYVCAFFEGYSEYLFELMNEDGIPDDEKFDKLCLYDNIDNLENYQGCVEYSDEAIVDMIKEEHLYYFDDLFDSLEVDIESEE